MALVQVGWKNFYEVEYDEFGAVISKRFVRREPVYKEVAEPIEVIKRALSSAAEALRGVAHKVYEQTTQRSIGTEDDLTASRDSATNEASLGAKIRSATAAARAASVVRSTKRSLASSIDVLRR